MPRWKKGELVRYRSGVAGGDGAHAIASQFDSSHIRTASSPRKNWHKRLEGFVRTIAPRVRLGVNHKSIGDVIDNLSNQNGYSSLFEQAHASVERDRTAVLSPLAHDRRAFRQYVRAIGRAWARPRILIEQLCAIAPDAKYFQVVTDGFGADHYGGVTVILRPLHNAETTLFRGNTARLARLHCPSRVVAGKPPWAMPRDLCQLWDVVTRRFGTYLSIESLLFAAACEWREGDRSVSPETALSLALASQHCGIEAFPCGVFNWEAVESIRISPGVAASLQDAGQVYLSAQSNAKSSRAMEDRGVFLFEELLALGKLVEIANAAGSTVEPIWCRDLGLRVQLVFREEVER